MDTIQDFLQKYQETHFREKKTGKIVSVGGDSGGAYLTIECTDGSSYRQSYNKDFVSSMDFSPPTTGNFNYRGYCLRLYRTAVRQWKWGLSRTNHTILNPLQILLVHYENVYKPVWSSSLVEAMFNKGFAKSLGEVYRQFREVGAKSFAITANVSFSLNPTEDTELLLWYKHLPVGYLGERENIEVREKLYEQEVFDELRRWKH